MKYILPQVAIYLIFSLINWNFVVIEWSEDTRVAFGILSVMWVFVCIAFHTIKMSEK